jgi:hypothetical protein
VLSATNEGCRNRLPQSIVERPLQKLDRDDERGLSYSHAAIFSAVIPAPKRPFDTSGRLENGHSGVSSF